MPPARKSGGLPKTSYAVLGLLSFGERSGYDLKALADYSIANFFWSPAGSQIYAELRRLTYLGFVTETMVRQERRPDKRIYQLTTSGQGALSDWLEIPEVEPDIFKSTFLLKIFLGRSTQTETIVAQVEERRQQIEERISQLEEKEATLRDRPELAFAYITLKSGLAANRAQLLWTEEVVEELKMRDPGQSYLDNG
jgi:DNA-binding PadR family transcriptional regulator